MYDLIAVSSLLVVSLLFFPMCTFATEPDATAFFANQRLRFYCKTRSYASAEQICEANNSFLGKIDNANITKVVNSLIAKAKCSYPEDAFVGATATPHPHFPNDGSKRTWKWSDGSKVYLRNEDGYKNWRPGQPNDFQKNEDCLLVGKDRLWIDSSCKTAKYFICQEKIDLTVEIVNISNGRRCVASAGSWLAHTEWQRDNTIVTSSSSNTIYQTMTPGSSLLHYENATIRDAGEYVCVAYVSYNEKDKKFAKEEIFVNGTPTITNISSFSCNTSMHIVWMPQSHSLGFCHRITATTLTGTMKKDFEVTPNETISHFIEFTELDQSTEYVIEIVACKGIDECSDEYSTTKMATTFGTNVTVINAFIKQDNNTANNDVCVITWEWHHDTSAVFKIKLHSSSLRTPNVSDTKYIDITGDQSYSFDPIFEQVYDVEIQPETSEKYCPQSAKAVGSCFGRKAAEGKQTKALLIIIPSVAAGIVVLLAICIFVFCKRMKSTRESTDGMTTNPIYGVTDYGNLHSSSNHQNIPVQDKAAGGECSTTRKKYVKDVEESYPDADVYAVVNKPNRKRLEEGSSSSVTCAYKSTTEKAAQTRENMVVNPIYDMTDFTSQPTTSQKNDGKNYEGGAGNSDQQSSTDDPIYSAVKKVKTKKNKKGDYIMTNKKLLD